MPLGFIEVPCGELQGVFDPHEASFGECSRSWIQNRLRATASEIEKAGHYMTGLLSRSNDKGFREIPLPAQYRGG
jgi:hypothetical protein